MQQGIDLSSLRKTLQSTYIPNLSQNYRNVIEDTISSFGLGERIQYDWGLTAAPSPNGQLMPVYVLTMSMPTLVLGELAQIFAILEAMNLSQESLQELIQQSIESMRQKRDEQAEGIALS